jgi:hypothetical protein
MYYIKNIVSQSDKGAFFAVVPVVRNVNEFHSLPVASGNEVKAAS